MINKTITGLVILAALLIAAFSVWYSGGITPLSSAEVNQLINKIQSQPKTPGGKHDISKLKQFLNDDDGQPFYTVNLYKYYPQAQYTHGSGMPREMEGTGRQAYDRFSKVMVGLLAMHASHPIFGSAWMDSNINEWDRLVIVRYRSRRDIAQIFASDEFAQASTHKWAGLEKNQRLLVQGLHIPELLLMGLLLGLLVLFVLGRRLYGGYVKRKNQRL